MIVKVLVTAVLVPLSMAGAVAAIIWLASFYLRVWRRLRSTMTSSATDNRTLYWPIVLAIVWPLLFALLWLLYEMLSWLPLIPEVLFTIIGGGLAALWLGSVVFACRLMIQGAAARHWRMVLSTLILPLTFFPALLSFLFLLEVSGTAANYVRFFLVSPSYFATIESWFPPIDALVFAVFLALLMAGAVVVPVGVGTLCAKAWEWLRPRMTSPASDNRILYWPAVLAIVWPLLLALLWLFFEMSAVLSFISENFAIITLASLWFILVAGLGLVAMWVGSVAIACKLMIQWALARHWRMVLSTAVLPLAFLPVLLDMPFLWKESRTADEYVKFSFGYPFYLGRFEERNPTKPLFAVWADWPYDDHAVLYDETDEIAADHQSEAWKKKAEANGVICCGHRHVLGHFYYVSVDLP